LRSRGNVIPGNPKDLAAHGEEPPSDGWKVGKDYRDFTRPAACAPEPKFLGDCWLEWVAIIGAVDGV